MKKIILVRYGELALKSKSVRRRFEKRLVRNIRSALGEKAEVRLTYSRIMIKTKNDDALKRVFGIVSFSHCNVIDAKMDKILDLGLSVAKSEIKKGNVFAVKTNRVGKHIFTSDDINKKLGALIVEKLGNKVNLSKPDKTIFVEVRDKKTYVYSDVIKGPGGLPVGVGGKVVVLLENKDSLSAAWIALKRGCEIIPVFVGKKNIKWFKLLERWSYGYDLKANVVKSKQPKEIEKAIHENSAIGLITSEKLDNIDSFNALKSSISVPVYRPLLCLSEPEIKHINRLFIN